MSVHHHELAKKFFEHFFKLATKTESIDPFFTETCNLTFGDEQFSGKEAVLEKLAPLLPLTPCTTHSFVEQPYSNGRCIVTANARTEIQPKIDVTENVTCVHFIITFLLAEIDVSIHRYGITHIIVLPIEQ
ncbi:hypothetical protein TVAGG3_0172910 [Trichomonas vaginalis G3]|uniref:hypothetical protein n=1 Tax=Trichomonas vaginalis (strain ATCC PRA-98 / G3) TaxID=412133 RepID=UPI0021E60453|nr:hypothetical protein TVAGG3_0172910 [Trichomonas vaginalis G3]KAI5548717.1 hypothetical protein TVAGG3_0172910 [Trichomonas vaginalis G3]